jgi:hypothetical protein
VFLVRVHVALYWLNTVEWAGLIVALGGRWLALLAPLLAAFGPRYCTIGQLVATRSFMALLLAFAVLSALLARR